MGDKDERGKALSVNVERGAGIFCKIVIVGFLFIRYRSDSLYYKMACIPSSPTLLFIRVVKNRVGGDGVPAIMQYKPSDLYLTDRKEKWKFCKKIPAPLSTFADKAFPRSSLSPTTSLLSN